MPRTPRNSPNPPGRPAKASQAQKAIERARRTGESLEEAARAEGVSVAAVHAHKAKRRAGKGASSSPPPSGAPSSPLAPAAPPAATQAPPQGGAVSGKPELLELLRRMGKARNAAAWAEIEEGLRVYTAGGEEALAPWLVRPLERAELDGDELDVLREGLAFAVTTARTAEPGGPLLRALTAVERIGKSVSVVVARRPPEPKPDEVQEAIRGEMEACVGHLLRHTGEAKAALAKGRASLFDGLDIGPAARAQLERRIGAMLGEAAP